MVRVKIHASNAHIDHTNDMNFHHFLCLAAREYVRITSAINKNTSFPKQVTKLIVVFG